MCFSGIDRCRNTGEFPIGRNCEPRGTGNLGKGPTATAITGLINERSGKRLIRRRTAEREQVGVELKCG